MPAEKPPCPAGETSASFSRPPSATCTPSAIILIKFTFPALRERLLPHRVELYDIDLRWGITEDEAKNEKVIHLCLEQIDACRPFFLAFLGHRYGWVPPRIPTETQTQYPFVATYPASA